MRRYVATPAFAAHDKDARRQRAAANKARRKAEQALVALHRRAHPDPAANPGPDASAAAALTATLREGTDRGKPGDSGSPGGSAGGAGGAGGAPAAQGVDQGRLGEGPRDGGDGEPAVNPFLAAPLWEDRAARGCKPCVDVRFKVTRNSLDEFASERLMCGQCAHSELRNQGLCLLRWCVCSQVESSCTLLAKYSNALSQSIIPRASGNAQAGFAGLGRWRGGAAIARPDSGSFPCGAGLCGAGLCGSPSRHRRAVREPAGCGLQRWNSSRGGVAAFGAALQNEPSHLGPSTPSQAGQQAEMRCWKATGALSDTRRQAWGCSFATEGVTRYDAVVYSAA